MDDHHDHHHDMYGVPLLDKIYTLEPQHLDGTLSGACLLQFADQELERIQQGSENNRLYFNNPSAGYVPPSGEATKERAKLRLARADYERQSKAASAASRQKPITLTSRQRTSKAFHKSICARYRSLMSGDVRGSSAESNRLMKAISSVSPVKNHHHHHLRHYDPVREPAGPGMLAMKKPPITVHHQACKFDICNDPTYRLVRFDDDSNHSSSVNATSSSNNANSTIVTTATTTTTTTSKKNMMPMTPSPPRRLTTDKEEDGSKITTKIDYQQYANAKVPRRPTRKKKKYTRENRRMMREIQQNLESEDDYVPYQVDLSSYDLDFTGKPQQRGGEDSKVRNRNDASGSKLVDAGTRANQKYISDNVNRVVAATEAASISAPTEIAGRHYGFDRHTSSYPSVFKKLDPSTRPNTTAKKTERYYHLGKIKKKPIHTDAIGALHL